MIQKNDKEENNDAGDDPAGELYRIFLDFSGRITGASFCSFFVFKIDCFFHDTSLIHTMKYSIRIEEKKQMQIDTNYVFS